MAFIPEDPTQDPRKKPGVNPAGVGGGGPAPGGPAPPPSMPPGGGGPRWDPNRPDDPKNTDDPTIDLGRFGEGSALAGSRYGEGRGLQMDALQRYQDILEGKGTSLAQAQLQQQSDQNAAQALSMAAMGRGGNTAAMAGQAGAQLAGNQMATNQQAAMLRAQEEQAALAGMGGLASTVAGQDIGAQLAFEQMMSSGMEAQLGADTEFRLGSRALAEQERQGKFDRIMGGLQGAAAMGGSMMGAAFSDKRAKTNVKPYSAGRDPFMFSDERAKTNAMDLAAGATDAIRALDPVEFDYKPGMGPPGRQTGVMAQDLEKSEVGRGMVMRRPGDGMRMVDTNQAAMLALAGAAAQQKELDELKKKVK